MLDCMNKYFGCMLRQEFPIMSDVVDWKMWRGSETTYANRWLHASTAENTSYFPTASATAATTSKPSPWRSGGAFGYRKAMRIESTFAGSLSWTISPPVSSSDPGKRPLSRLRPHDVVGIWTHRPNEFLYRNRGRRLSYDSFVMDHFMTRDSMK